MPLRRATLPFAILTIALFAVACRAADEVEPGVSLTVYNDDFAVVKDVRRMSLPNELSTVAFRDVAERIDPTSVHFRSLTDPAGTAVLEQNYEYDLVSADKLLNKYIDRPIRVVTEDGTPYEGRLLSFDNQQLVIMTDAAPVLIQRPDNVTDIAFSALPEGLLTKPTLVWQVRTAEPGDHLVQVAYQTEGLGWEADYNAVLDEGETALELGGWVTLNNRSGASYEQARLKLIAGDVRRERQAQVQQRREVREMAVAADAAQRGFEQQQFFEYHLYTLGRPTTVKDNQMKQIELLSADAVPVTKTYVFEPFGPYWWSSRRYGDENEYKVHVFVEFDNAEESNLGMPLPAGKVRLYKRNPDDRSLEFVGEDRIDHTPKDERIKLYVGDAFDLIGEYTVKEVQQRGSWRKESIEVRLRNHKAEDVTILLRPHMRHHGEWTITDASHELERVEARVAEVRVPVEADGETVVTWDVEYRW